MTLQIVDADDRATWETEQGPECYPSQTWSYAASLRLSGLVPRLALIKTQHGRMLMPFFERSWQGSRDIATLPSLSGASLSGQATALLDAWYEYARQTGWVAGYIQLANGQEAIPLQDKIRTHTFRLNLDGWSPASTPSPIIRRKTRAAIRAACEVEHDRAALTAALHHLYPLTLRRFGRRSPFSSGTLDQWASDPATVLIGVRAKHAVEAIHLIHVHGARAELQLVGTSERGRAMSALLYVASIERLQERGVRSYNIGGGGNPGDGLYQFKTWLGAEPSPLRAVRQVYDEARFLELCATAGSKASEWFPPYRAGQGTNG